MAENDKTSIAHSSEMKDVADIPDAPPCDLPFSDEADDPEAVLTDVPMPAVAPRFKITYNRIMKYTGTPGCRACLELGEGNYKHTIACRKRFLELLTHDGELGKGAVTLEPVPPGAEQPDAPLGPVPNVLLPRGDDRSDGEPLHDTSQALGPAPDDEEPESPNYSASEDECPTPLAPLLHQVAGHRQVLRLSMPCCSKLTRH